MGSPPLAELLASWSPDPVRTSDNLPPAPAAALAAVAGLLPVDDDALPPFWHWLYFLTWPAHAELGPDGHLAEGHFHPPIPDRRRMVAGGRVEIREPLRIGVPARRETSLAAIEVKRGSTGDLAFVTLRHVISQEGSVRVIEEHNLVYRRGAPAPAAALTLADRPPAADEPWQHLVVPDTRLLFRFSALTANAHRIHYDEPYARDVEGFSGLVVHGPLLVLHLLDLVRRHAPQRPVASVSYRLRSPVLCGEPVLAAGRPGTDGPALLRIATARESRHATAEITLR